MLDPDRDYTDADLAALDEFTLGEPVLVCRWRLSDRRIPMAGRHIRALGERVTDGWAPTPEFLAWVRQHLEQTLDSGAADDPDGVLMLAVDAAGHGAMAVGPYEPLADTSAAALAARAAASAEEGARTSVAPETLWAVADGALLAGFGDTFTCGGAGTLLMDLTETLGRPVTFDGTLAQRVAAGEPFDEVFLVSDEHGVVPASDNGGPVAETFAAQLGRLREATAARQGRGI